MSNRPINLKRLRMEVVEHRYSTYPVEVPVMLKLIDELAQARELLIKMAADVIRES
jgi:hypothetical protein